MRSGQGRGWGKIILLGEHAVVHGRPALAAAIGRSVEARAAPRDGASTLRVRPWNVEASVAGSGEPSLAAALGAVAARMPQGDPRLSIEAQVNLPSRVGLGSSAALGVAVTRAMIDAIGVSWTNEQVAAVTLEWERVFHGNPSGVDSTLSACGGIAIFRRGDPIERIHLPRPLRVVVGDSGERSSTKEMVAQVASQHAAKREQVEKVFDGIAALVRDAALALCAGNLGSLGQLLDLNHALLASLFLSTAAIEDLRAAAKAAGAAGSKVTGAGGGGCVVAVVEEPAAEERVLDAWRSRGYQGFIAEVG